MDKDGEEFQFFVQSNRSTSPEEWQDIIAGSDFVQDILAFLDILEAILKKILEKNASIGL